MQFLGGRYIPVYGLAITIGCCGGVLLGYYLMKRNHLSVDDFILSAAYSAVGGFIGAKLLYLWVSRNSIQWDRFFEFEYFKMIMSGGFVFYGGLIGGLISLWCAGKIHRIYVRDYISVCIPAVPLIHGFGRIGCGLAGCCYGIPYDGLFAVKYTSSVAAPLNISLFPVQYLEAFLNFIISLVLFVLVIKKGNDIKNFYLYLIFYCVVRFILEFLRYDETERGIWNGLSTSQWISIIIFMTVSFLMIVHKRFGKICKKEEKNGRSK